MKKIVIGFILLFLFVPLSVDARSGCCSYHQGVRADGCGCNDGTPLSSTCAPYYSCQQYTVPVQQNEPINTPTSVPVPTATPTLIPTAIPTPTVTSTPTIKPKMVKPKTVKRKVVKPKPAPKHWWDFLFGK